jgi:hypothetical protein
MTELLVGPLPHGGLRDGPSCWAVAKEPIIMIRLKQEIMFVFIDLLSKGIFGELRNSSEL